jgi:protein CpxP
MAPRETAFLIHSQGPDMKYLSACFLALACSGAIASALALSSDAGPEFGPGPQGDGGPGAGMHMPPPHGGPGMLRGVALSEAQEQKAFAIRHAAEALMFEQMRILRKAHDTLRDAGASPQFDEAKAASAAAAAGRASAAIALSRARVESQLLALLTPEQRSQLARPEPRSPR